jgi:hypothetical protein
LLKLTTSYSPLQGGVASPFEYTLMLPIYGLNTHEKSIFLC